MIRIVMVAGMAMGSAVVQAEKPCVPTEQYERREVEGWTVFVNRELLTDPDGVGAEALKLLECKLFEIRRVVPEAACRELRAIPIWLGVDDGHAPCAEYHPSADWLRENGYNPDKAKSVEIGCAARFVEWSRHQPMMVLHELAHGYHDRVLGYEHPTVRAAYEAAVASGKYEQVLKYDGSVGRAYALENPQEYFAELTECFFGTNDFYPFVRAELEPHDPEGYRLLKELWAAPPAAGAP
jgi:hypothetical protein